MLISEANKWKMRPSGRSCIDQNFAPELDAGGAATFGQLAADLLGNELQVSVRGPLQPPR